MAQILRAYKREIHPDFPHEAILGSVAGMQPKLLLRETQHGSYISPQPSVSDVMERFEACDDLADQLGIYFMRKKNEHPEWSDEQNLERIRIALLEKAASGRWPFTEAEQRWIMDRVCEDV